MLSSLFWSKDPDPQFHVVSLIDEVVRDGKTERVLSLTRKDAQFALDQAWDVLRSSPTLEHHSEDPPSPGSSPTSKRILLRISVKLALKHDILPSAIFLKNIKLIDPHSRYGGASADVYYAEQGDTPVALKKIRVFTSMSEAERQETMKALYRETLLWKGLSHPNVLPFVGVSDVFKGTICMVLLWRPKTIREHRTNLQAEGSLSVRAVNGWLHQIALGLAYLHEEGVVHGDLHGGNVLVDEKGIPQLTDFGMAVIVDGTSYAYHSKHGGGSIRHTAPELLHPNSAKLTSSRPTTASDVYSFSCLSVELYAGEKPFPALTDYPVVFCVLGGERPPRPSLLKGKPMANDLWDLIQSCWDPNPQSRPASRHVADKLGPQALVKSLTPTYEVVELPMKTEDPTTLERVLSVVLSENYFVVLTPFSIEVYSLDDLTHRGTIDPSAHKQFSQLAVVDDTLAYCSSDVDSPAYTIHICDLPGHRRCSFTVRASFSKLVAAAQAAETTPEPGSNTHARRSTFLVYHGNSAGTTHLGGIGTLVPPPEHSRVSMDAVLLMESGCYQRFRCPNDAFPLRDIAAQGDHAFASCRDKRIRRWNIFDGNCTQVVEMEAEVQCLSVDPLGWMACSWQESSLVSWDADGSSTPHTWSLNRPNGVHSYSAVTHFNHIIGKDGDSGNVHIWTHDLSESRTLTHGGECVNKFYCMQRSILTISRTRIKVWDILTGTELQSFDVESDRWAGTDKEIWQSLALFVKCNGRLLGIWAAGCSKLYLWRFEDGQG